jgi:hypothetical protein
MSLKQRRDHKPDYSYDAFVCLRCGDPIEYIEVVGYDRSKPVAERRTVRGYWRHVRRWFKKP